MQLSAILETSEQLLLLEPARSQPSDLPSRFGRAVRDIERLLRATEVPAAVAGGWSVWHHGYVGRVTEDVDIVIPQCSEADLLDNAPRFGFDLVPVNPGSWPKLEHRETGIRVDLMPEGRYPGIPSRLAPVPIGHPLRYVAGHDKLDFISLAGLFELKLGAKRAKDIADLIELIKVNQSKLSIIRVHLQSASPAYAAEFDALIVQANEET